MAYTVRDLTGILALTEDQVRVRLDRFASVLDGHARRGQFNRIEIDNSGLAILQRAKQLEELHGDLRTVRTLLLQENPNTVKAQADNPIAERDEGVWEASAKVIETLENENAHLREEIAFLRNQIEGLMPLALPRPRGWFSWLRLLGRGG